MIRPLRPAPANGLYSALSVLFGGLWLTECRRRSFESTAIVVVIALIVALGLITRSDAEENNALTELVGTWAGTVYQPGSETYPVEILVRSGGSTISVEYPTLSCGGSLARAESPGGQIFLRERIEHNERGRCITDGVVELELRLDGRLRYGWHYPRTNPQTARSGVVALLTRTADVSNESHGKAPQEQDRRGQDLPKQETHTNPPQQQQQIRPEQHTSTVSTTLIFKNESASALSILWKDNQGREVFYKALAAGEAYQQSTYATHQWVIRRQGDQSILAVVVATPVPMVVTINRDGAQLSELPIKSPATSVNRQPAQSSAGAQNTPRVTGTMSGAVHRSVAVWVDNLLAGGLLLAFLGIVLLLAWLKGTLRLVGLWFAWIGVSFALLFTANWLVQTFPSPAVWLLGVPLWLIALPGVLIVVLAAIPTALLGLAFGGSSVAIVAGFLGGLALSTYLVLDWLGGADAGGGGGGGAEGRERRSGRGRERTRGRDASDPQKRSPLSTASSMWPDLFGFGRSLWRRGESVGRLEQPYVGDDTLVLWPDRTPAGRITTNPSGRRIIEDAHHVPILEITTNFAGETVIVDKEGKQRRITKDFGGNTVIE